MATKNDKDYSPVERLSSESGAGFLSGQSWSSSAPSSPSSRRWVVFLALALLASNSLWVGIFAGYSLGVQKVVPSPAIDLLDHKDHDELSTAFHWNTPFSNDNKTISNPLWASLFPRGAGLVTVEKSWAMTRHLPLSLPNPADKDSVVYFVAGFHQLHCVTVVRAALYHFRENKEQTVPWNHVTHCLDSLRQLVQCKADGALLYTEDANVFGDGQIHQCNDWDALAIWASDHSFEQQLP
ncbi:hypothetical protein B0T24DRAFT_125786 [Lasiosphaeria ovina]|uniref:Oxidase ustYa n=1 Tax=Lasiosphaeria ovina TaxID=92902 RepID=A0AAE0MY75_9PEZI|nr:hypothetical protein B0T24DRAFT_125786 [Lasiosphaeria ovina]